MKNIYYILLFATSCILLFTGCSSDDDANGATLKIIKSNVSFEDVGGEGTIEVLSEAPFEVSVEADWCTYTVSGNTIKLNVEPNTSIEGRNATVAITSGDEKPLLVNVIQAGGVFYLSSGNQNQLYFLAGGSQSVTIFHSQPYSIEFSEDCDWMSYEVEGDKVTFTVPETDTPRAVTVNFKLGKKVIPVKISQSAFLYNEFIGTYTMSFTNRNVRKEKEITISEKEKGKSYTVSGLDFEFESQYDPINGAMIISPQWVGKALFFDVYLTLFSTENSGRRSVNSQYPALGVWNEEVGGFNFKLVSKVNNEDFFDSFSFTYYKKTDDGGLQLLFDYLNISEGYAATFADVNMEKK